MSGSESLDMLPPIPRAISSIQTAASSESVIGLIPVFIESRDMSSICSSCSVAMALPCISVVTHSHISIDFIRFIIIR